MRQIAKCDQYEAYTVLSDTDIDRLQKNIKEKKAEGWETYGSPYSRNMNIYQPMAKKKKEV